MIKNKVDITVFGATGFTGLQVCQVTDQVARKLSLKWAMAGRDKEKLQQLRTQFESLPEIFEADTTDKSSLIKMAEHSKVVLNCVGPFRFHGEQVVDACIQGGSDYLDISGEPQFIEMSLLKYNDAAKTQKVRIVHACGFDSVPADFGALLLRSDAQTSGFPLCHIDSFLQFDPGSADFRVNYATYVSAIHGLQHWDHLGGLRRSLRENRWPIAVSRFLKESKLKKHPFYDSRIKGWATLFMGADASVVMSTQRTLTANGNTTTFPHYNAYYRFDRVTALMKAIRVAFRFMLLARSKVGRNLLLKFPEFFSSGFVSKTNPSREQLKTATFKMSMLGVGDNHKNYPRQLEVTGPDPGYVATPHILVQLAVLLLKNEGLTPRLYGTFTPGALFDPSTARDVLKACGIDFRFSDA